MDLGVYKTSRTPPSPTSSPLSRSSISYQIARACSYKGSLAGTAGREVIEGLRGDSDEWEEAARAIIQIEGVEGTAEDSDDEEAVENLEELGEDELKTIDRLGNGLQGYCKFSETACEALEFSPVDRARLKAIVVGSKWVLDTCWTPGFGAQVERTLKRACETVLKLSNWKVTGNKTTDGCSWGQESCAKRHLHMHHILRSLVQEGCGGKEDERVEVIYGLLKEKLRAPDGTEGWCKWASNVRSGGLEMPAVSNFGPWSELRSSGGRSEEVGDDVVSLFVAYAESVVMRGGEGNFKDAVAIVTGYVEARSGVKVWEVKGRVEGGKGEKGGGGEKNEYMGWLDRKKKVRAKGRDDDADHRKDQGEGTLKEPEERCKHIQNMP